MIPMQAGEKSHLSAHACILWSARFLFSLTAVYFCLPTKRKKTTTNKTNKKPKPWNCSWKLVKEVTLARQRESHVNTH